MSKYTFMSGLGEWEEFTEYDRAMRRAVEVGTDRARLAQDDVTITLYRSSAAGIEPEADVRISRKGDIEYIPAVRV